MSRVLIFVALFWSSYANSGEATKSRTIVERVGGTYRVAKIAKRGERDFRITFQAEKKTGKFDTLVLNSDHVHVAVYEGQDIRLSAEVLSTPEKSQAMVEVSQVMLFLPNHTGPVPVWLLSNRTPPRELRASKYLEMHVPHYDFIVL